MLSLAGAFSSSESETPKMMFGFSELFLVCMLDSLRVEKRGVQKMVNTKCMLLSGCVTAHNRHDH